MLNNKKIAFIFALVGAFLIGTLTSCGGGSGDGPGRDKVQKIKFLHIWSESAGEFTKITNNFMAENDDIEIETIVSDYSNVPTYLNNQIMSNSLPDVFFYWTKQVYGYSQMDVCLPLNSYMEGWSSTFEDPECWDLGKYNGNYYSVPFRCTGETLVYNKTLFKENGLVFPNNLEEFETLLSNLRKLSINPQFSPFAVSGITGGSLTDMYTAFERFLALSTGYSSDPNYSTGLLEEDETFRTYKGKCLDKLRDWNSKGYFGYADGKTKDTTIRNFMEGNAAMLILNNNNLYLLDEMEDVELGFAAIPSPAGLDYTYLTSDYDGFSISKNTRYPEACIRFLKYLTSKDVSQAFSDSTNSVMAAGGIEYKNDTTKQVSQAMKDCSKAIFTQNESKYSTTNIDRPNSEAVLNYILGGGNYGTGKEVAEFVWNNYYKTMRDAGFSPIPVLVNLDYSNLSWLDILK